MVFYLITYVNTSNKSSETSYRSLEYIRDIISAHPSLYSLKSAYEINRRGYLHIHMLCDFKKPPYFKQLNKQKPSGVTFHYVQIPNTPKDIKQVSDYLLKDADTMRDEDTIMEQHHYRNYYSFIDDN